ncbi:NAD(P)/FAD-dependent oxidoreductase [Salinicola acroporae]|uniref:Aminoacetone oxidase family FAD-binding enzyme n=1 Tax=Salinicola acroporae TaxID=1541440 RepID=A0ABT6I800_9GAMM|nr:NAD(P)/FAD-dependent oxidoreductase [Salinicola acroporae]MDH4573524.1 aminoacetone oxidase family FAD-binding enzyme [Salinicola acroporae]
MKTYDVIVIGAGAAGLMCALTAGYRGLRVRVVDHASKAGKKILMSGGGRCNFTNLATTPAHFFSRNPHFSISALKRYTPHHFVELVERHGVEYVEKAPGQLFCAQSAKEIVSLLLTECEWAGVEVSLSTKVGRVERQGEGMQVEIDGRRTTAGAVVVATGGLSVPTLGASGFGYDLARQFGLAVTETRAALVPFTVTSQWKASLASLSGLSCPVVASCGDGAYREPLLFTHRGLSGPAMLQASSHWQPGMPVAIDWLPSIAVAETLADLRRRLPRRRLGNWLGELLPKRLSQALIEWQGWQDRPLAELSNADIEAVASGLGAWQFKPAGTEGWRTAEVTMGGVDTAAVSSKTFAVDMVPQLYFIGEVLDVTGQLGGFNFQWAWSSGVACGQAV